MNFTVARILPLFLLSATIVPSGTEVDLNSLLGKEASWNLDSDLDGKIDGKLIVDDISSGGGSGGIRKEDLKCVITFKNLTSGSEAIFSDSSLSWNGIYLVEDDLTSCDQYRYGVFAGVVRKYIEVNGSFDGLDCVLAYDRSTGLLLGAYIVHGAINPIEDNKTDCMRIESTNVFFNTKGLIPFILICCAAVGAIAIIYTATVTVLDKKKRSKRACFDPGCWE